LCNSKQKDNSYLIDSTDENDENIMTGGNNYNNFLWRYATNRLDNDTIIKQINDKTAKYGDLQKKC